MPPDAAREITVPGTELRLPGKSFTCYQLTSVVREPHCVRKTASRPACTFICICATSLAPSHRWLSHRRGHRLIREDAVSSEGGSHRRGQAMPGKYGPACVRDRGIDPVGRLISRNAVLTSQLPTDHRRKAGPGTRSSTRGYGDFTGADATIAAER